MNQAIPKLPYAGAVPPVLGGNLTATFANGIETYPVPNGVKTYTDVSKAVELMEQAPPKKTEPAPYILKSVVKLF